MKIQRKLISSLLTIETIVKGEYYNTEPNAQFLVESGSPLLENDTLNSVS